MSRVVNALIRAARLSRLSAYAVLTRSPTLSAMIYKYYVYPAPRGCYKLHASACVSRDSGSTDFPVPPQYLRPGYGSTVEEWLRVGQRDIDTMMKLVTADDFAIQGGSRILDLGCQSGRMIRWLASSAEQCEIWGVDVSARHIVWCQENLSPPFMFATVTTNPHLPFRDEYFDLVYCGSVFTHIDDLSDAWLLEVKRIMRPGGRAYITVHDNHTVDLVINHIDRVPYAKDLRESLLSYDKHLHFMKSDWYKFCVEAGSPRVNVFYNIDYLRQYWGRMLHIVSITPEAYGYQTAVVLKR